MAIYVGLHSSWGSVNKCLLIPDKAPTKWQSKDNSRVQLGEPIELIQVAYRSTGEVTHSSVAEVTHCGFEVCRANAHEWRCTQKPDPSVVSAQLALRTKPDPLKEQYTPLTAEPCLQSHHCRAGKTGSSFFLSPKNTPHW